MRHQDGAVAVLAIARELSHLMYRMTYGQGHVDAGEEASEARRLVSVKETAAPSGYPGGGTTRERVRFLLGPLRGRHPRQGGRAARPAALDPGGTVRATTWPSPSKGASRNERR